MQNSIVKVSKCFNIFYTIFTQVLDKIENFEFPRNAQCLLSASLKSNATKHLISVKLIEQFEPFK